MTQPMTQTTVFEVCLLSIKPGMEAEFEAGVRQAAPLFRRAKGPRIVPDCHGRKGDASAVSEGPHD